jgi:dipeptidyl-peptidase-4
MNSDQQLSFPRHAARTQRFTLGVPRGVRVAPDGARVTFLRAPSGTDPATGLWALDLVAGAGGTERLVVDPRSLLAGDAGEPSPQERARRERSREAAGGIVGYAGDRAGRQVSFTLSGRLFVADVVAGETRELAAQLPAVDPRLDPTGRRVAYVGRRCLRVHELDTGADRPVAAPAAAEAEAAEAEEEEVSWGLAEFVAAEEMDRMRGFWWAPSGDRLLAARVDESGVRRWYIADPSAPDRAPAPHAYPAAGTPNADVSLWLVDLDGTRREVRWDRERLPYLVTVRWDDHGCLLVAQSRDQRVMQVRSIDPASGATSLVREDTDPRWLEIVRGVPAHLDDGRLVWAGDLAGARRLLVGGEPVTPDGLQVRAVLHAGADVLFTASSEPTEVHVWRWAPDGGASRVSTTPGVHTAAAGGGVTVLASSSLDFPGVKTTVWRDHALIAEIESRADVPAIRPSVSLLATGDRELRTAVLLPTGHQAGSRRLPVLLAPYGGPHAQRVLAAQAGFSESQWFADQGFAVVIADGRGTPGRGPEWEREIAADWSTAVLEDQVDALHGAAATYPDLDLTRVGIRGWSFGGYLAALAVLRRPDIFHAAVAGAPVTDWALYDTHYTERYLGLPADRPDAYAAASLLGDAEKLVRPLMLIHGLADDNVVSAHTLRLSSALLAAGRPHTVLPLSGVTHMASQEDVAENLLLLQVDFLRQALMR